MDKRAVSMNGLLESKRGARGDVNADAVWRTDLRLRNLILVFNTSVKNISHTKLKFKLKFQNASKNYALVIHMCQNVECEKN